MGSIRFRGDHQFQASVRIKGTRPQTKTFETRREAEDWITETEAKIRRDEFIDRREAQKTPLYDILQRYERLVAPTKRGGASELHRLRQLKRHPLAEKRLAQLGPADFSSYRDERLMKVSPGTVLRELGLLSSVLNCAIKDWGYPIENPIPSIRRPTSPDHRDRRLRGDEEERLIGAARSASCRAPQLADVIVLAIETGMRAGEILSLSPSNVFLDRHHVVLTHTKNGSKRVVPLSERAEEVLRRLTEKQDSEKLFTFYDTQGLSRAFRSACKRAGIENLKFHDLRHEAASRLAMRIPSPATLAKILGWRTLQMAMRYYNPTVDELVRIVRTA